MKRDKLYKIQGWLSILLILIATVQFALQAQGAEFLKVAIAPFGAISLLLFAFFLYNQVMRADQGTPRMQDIARAVQEGASAYLNRQFRTLVWFAAVVVILLLFLPADSNGIRLGRSLALPRCWCPVSPPQLHCRKTQR